MVSCEYCISFHGVLQNGCEPTEEMPKVCNIKKIKCSVLKVEITKVTVLS